MKKTTKQQQQQQQEQQKNNNNNTYKTNFYIIYLFQGEKASNIRHRVRVYEFLKSMQS